MKKQKITKQQKWRNSLASKGLKQITVTVPIVDEETVKGICRMMRAGYKIELEDWE